MGFPGLILYKNGNRISGYIFSSENLSGYWDKLDAFEGIEYKRVNYVLNDKRLTAAGLFSVVSKSI